MMATTMDAPSLIALLRERDVKLWVAGDQHTFRAPLGALDAELLAIVASRKQDILKCLRQAEALRSSASTIVAIKPEGSKPPIFVVSGHGGDVYYFVALARQLDPDQPLLGVQPRGLDGREPLQSLEALAYFEVAEIRRYQPQGPYLIAGHCSGGTLAFEVAQQLIAAGQDVALLALIGSPFPTIFKPVPQLFYRFSRHAKGLLWGSLEERQRYIENKLQRRAAASTAGNTPQMAARERVESATMASVRRYKPRYYPGQIDLFVTSDEWRQSRPWRSLAETVREHDLTDYGRDELLLGSKTPALAAALTNRLRTI